MLRCTIFFLNEKPPCFEADRTKFTASHLARSRAMNGKARQSRSGKSPAARHWARGRKAAFAILKKGMPRPAPDKPRKKHGIGAGYRRLCPAQGAGS